MQYDVYLNGTPFFPVGRGFGLWTVQSPAVHVGGNGYAVGSCQLYGHAKDGDILEDQFDSSMSFARAMSILALIFSVLISVLVSISLFLQSLKKTYLLFQGATMYFIVVLMILQFVVLDSGLCREQLNCRMSLAGSYAITAAVLWFLAGTLSFFVDSTEEKDFFASENSFAAVEHPTISTSVRSAADVEESHPQHTIVNVPELPQKQAEDDVTSVTDVNEEVDGKLETISLE